jgi:hypothetical protein
MGALHAHWSVSGIYLTNSFEQCAHVLRTSKCKVLLVEDAEFYKNRSV